jgi:hypothetical protein
MHGLFRAFFYPTTTIKKHHKMKGTGDIDGAIAEIERQKANGEAVNLQKTADKFSVTRSRLSRRTRGVTCSWSTYLDESTRHLTAA